jgi:hypothetical protein
MRMTQGLASSPELPFKLTEIVSMKNAKDREAQPQSMGRGEARVTAADWAAHQLIAEQRQEAAEFAFQSYDFGDAVVESADGWESVTSNSPEGEYSRKVYIAPEEGGGPTEGVSFSVRFDDLSVIPSDLSALLMSSGAEIGFMPSSEESPLPK